MSNFLYFKKIYDKKENENLIESKQCVNYIFCKGVSFADDLCLLCGFVGEDNEAWGKLEFIETNEDCSVCYNKGIQVKFPTNCGHSFCIKCSQNLLYYQDDNFDICPIAYGCPPCKHEKSCKKRPCSKEDELILDEWEEKDYNSFIAWNYDEFNYSNDDNDFYLSKKCPLCRKKYIKNKLT